MAIATTDIYIKESDGWVKVATNPTLFSIVSEEGNPWWFAITAGGAPAAGVIGQNKGRGEDTRHIGIDFPAGFTGEAYVSVANPANIAGNGSTPELSSGNKRRFGVIAA